MIKPTNKTCNKEVQKFTNTSYDILLDLYNNTAFFKDLWDYLNPGYYLDFSGGLGGWQATEGTGSLTPNGNSVISIGGDFFNNNLDIDADNNKFLSVIFDGAVSGFIGDVEITYNNTNTVLFSGVIKHLGETNASVINLEQFEEHTGKITGIRFILNNDNISQYTLYKIVVGKPLLTFKSLIKLESEILSLDGRVTLLEQKSSNQHSRLNSLEENPVTLLKPDSLDEEVQKYEVVGLKKGDVTKKVLFKDDVIELVNSAGNSYFKYNISENSYEYKGIVVLSDGTTIRGVEDIRALDGQDGEPGDFTEFRFKRAFARPTINNTENNPAGFLLTPEEDESLGPVWFIVARKRFNGVLLGTWSTPSRLSGLDGRDGLDGSDGNDGQDGDDGSVVSAISVFLTNESYTAPTDPNGANPNLGGGTGTFMLYRGSDRVLSGVTFGGTTTKNGLTITINASSGAYSLSATNWNTEVEFFDLTAIFEGITYTKRYTVNKVRSGGGGQAGAGFFFVTVNSNTQTGALLQQTLNNAVLTQAGRVATQGDSFFCTWNDGTQGYVYNGTQWVNSAVTINGSIIASGTIAGDKLVANALYGKRQLISSDTHVYVVDPTGTELPNNMLVWYGPNTFSATQRTKNNGSWWIDKSGDFKTNIRKTYLSNGWSYGISSNLNSSSISLPSVGGASEFCVEFAKGVSAHHPSSATETPRLRIEIRKGGVNGTILRVEEIDLTLETTLPGPGYTYTSKGPITVKNFEWNHGVSYGESLAYGVRFSLLNIAGFTLPTPHSFYILTLTDMGKESWRNQ